MHGYTNRLWWHDAPNGFVITTHIEQLDGSSTPLRGNQRWLSGYTPPRLRESFGSWLKYLFIGKLGHYRFFAFVVTDELSAPTTPPTETDVSGWHVGDPGYRPDSLNTGKYTEHHRCTALVYEFVRHNKTDPLHAVRSSESRVEADQHLEQGGLLRDLTTVSQR
jgi:hypothetical protein